MLGDIADGVVARCVAQLRFGSAAVVDVDEDEVVYMAREMWRGRSARDQAARDVGRGMYRAMNYMCLTRYRRLAANNPERSLSVARLS